MITIPFDAAHSVEIFANIASEFSKPVTSKQAKQLACLAQQGDEKARCTLVLASIKLVLEIALYYAYHTSVSTLEDMISDGNWGLLVAIDKYDVSSNSDFFNYARYWIRERILKGVNDNSRLIRLPHDSYGLLKKIRQIENKFIEQFGSLPSTGELAEAVDASFGRVYDITHNDVDSIDCHISYGEDDSIEYNLPSDDDEKAEREKEEKEQIKSLLSYLSPRERYVITNLFGVEDGLVMDISVIADRLNLSAERVRQIKENALATMRRMAA